MRGSPSHYHERIRCSPRSAPGADRSPAQGPRRPRLDRLQGRTMLRGSQAEGASETADRKVLGSRMQEQRSFITYAWQRFDRLLSRAKGSRTCYHSVLKGRLHLDAHQEIMRTLLALERQHYDSCAMNLSLG